MDRTVDRTEGRCRLPVVQDVPQDIGESDLYVPESFQGQLEEPGVSQRSAPGILAVEVAVVTAPGRPDPRGGVLAEDAGMLVGGHRRIYQDFGTCAESCQRHAVEEDLHVPFRPERCLAVGGEADVIKIFHNS